MKLIIACILFLLSSCTKDWKCCIENDHINTDLGINNNSINCIDFRGSTEEKEEFEQDGTTLTNDGYGGSIELKTTCTPD